MNGPARWRALRFVLPPAREDEAVASLWATGAVGFESRPRAGSELELVAWSPEPPPESLRILDPRPWGGRLVGEERVGDEDWLREYRRWAKPFDLGRRFRIDPRDGDEAGPADGRGGERRSLRIPARTAFGTGSHESTRLAVELLEETDLAGRRVLDVGTGTGILALVALVLGASVAVGFDVDPASPPVARENGRANGLAAGWFTGRLDAISAGARFDVVVVNALPHEVEDELDGLGGRLVPGGRLVVSGMPTDRRGQVEARLERAGLRVLRRREIGRWTAVQAGRTAP